HTLGKSLGRHASHKFLRIGHLLREGLHHFVILQPFQSIPANARARQGISQRAPRYSKLLSFRSEGDEHRSEAQERIACLRKRPEVYLVGAHRPPPFLTISAVDRPSRPSVGVLMCREP